MRCALKRDCVEYVLFQGGCSDEYPSWFADLVTNGFYENEYRYWCVDPNLVRDHNLSIWSDILTEAWDVFLKNSSGEIMKTDIEYFDKVFLQVAENTAAPTDSVMEAVVYSGDPQAVYPDWFSGFMMNELRHYIKSSDQLPLVAVQKQSYNRESGLEYDYQIMDYELFRRNYHFPRNGIKTTYKDVYDIPYLSADEAGNSRL